MPSSARFCYNRVMLVCLLLSLTLSAAATQHVLIRTTDGLMVEGTATNLHAIGSARVDRMLSIHSAAPASAFEKGRIDEGLVAIQGKDNKARDLAVEELTAIGIPVMTPLLQIYKDTDQHEPRPLYRLFERVMPSAADGFDRSLSLIRMKGESIRVALPTDGGVEVKSADGKMTTIPWSKIRMLAIRQKSVARSVRVHSIQHSIQIEYLDTGLVTSAESKLDCTANGFVRLSWDADGWASDPNGLTKPGSPAYKSHLVNGHPFGALIARVGVAKEPIFLGKKATKPALGSGRLGLAINDNGHWQNNLGAFTVSLTATDAFDVGDAQ